MKVDTALATISYGWEPLRFYEEWSSGLPDNSLREFKGPALDTFQPQSKYANYFLDFFTLKLTTDAKYVERLKRHYAYMKYKQGMKTV